MNSAVNTGILTAIALAMVVASLFADPTEAEFLRLREKRDNALAAAAEPINDAYRASLEELLRRAVANGEEETARKLQFELQCLNTGADAPAIHHADASRAFHSADAEAKTVQAQLFNTKWRIDSGKTFVLHADGTTTSSWTPRKGHWKALGSNSLELSIWNVRRTDRVSVVQGGNLIVWEDKEADQAHPMVAKKIEAFEKNANPAPPLFVQGE